MAYDRERMSIFLRSYARTIGSQQSIPGMLGDLTSYNAFSFSEKTAYSYHKTLTNIFAIEEMPSFILLMGSMALLRRKLGGQENIDKGANSLLKLASRIDEDKMGPPSFIRYAAIKPARLVL